MLIIGAALWLQVVAQRHRGIGTGIEEVLALLWEDLFPACKLTRKSLQTTEPPPPPPNRATNRVKKYDFKFINPQQKLRVETEGRKEFIVNNLCCVFYCVIYSHYHDVVTL